MDTGHQCLPSLIAGRTVAGGSEQSVTDAPAHAVEKERGARHLRTAIGCGGVKTDIPKAISTLAMQQSLGHSEEVLLQQFVFLRVLIEDIHTPQQGRVDPTVAPTPIAVVAILLAVGRHIVLVTPPQSVLFAILLAVGRHIVLVTPPQSVLFIEESASTSVAAPQIAVDGIVEIAAVAGKTVILHIHRHRHLSTGHQRVARHSVALKISLSTALVVGIGGRDAVAWCPVVEGSPPVGIIEIALSWVDGIECHKTFIVHGTCPQRARPHLLHKGRPRRVGIHPHEAVVDTASQGQHAVGSAPVSASKGNVPKRQSSKDKSRRFILSVFSIQFSVFSFLYLVLSNYVLQTTKPSTHLV